MVAAAAQSTGILSPNSRIPMTQGGGQMTTQTLQYLQQMFTLINGLTPAIPCTCSNVGNVYSLTPFSISPILTDYLDYLSFPFVASASSTGTVTATVIPPGPPGGMPGTLATLPVLKNNGATPAGNGDIVNNLLYVLWYVDTLNSGNGAFVLK